MAGESSVRGDAREQLAAVLHRLCTAAITTGADTDALLTAVARLEGIARDLDAVPSVTRHRELTTQGLRPAVNMYDSPTHPMVPPLLTRHWEGGSYAGEATLSPAFEGAPGRLHGGMVAGLLDHAAGRAVSSENRLAMTVELTVRFLEATPYGVPLTVSAAIERTEGRKTFVTGAVGPTDGPATATMEALMIELRSRPVWTDRSLRPVGVQEGREVQCAQ